jgi:16S rRNA (cytosine1402-N4)-methyltransferase
LQLLKNLFFWVAVHIPVLLKKILDFVPQVDDGCVFDATAGGGGHFFAILKARPRWTGIAIDRDPRAIERIQNTAQIQGLDAARFEVHNLKFSNGGAVIGRQNKTCDFILADLGFSSFQIDDPTQGFGFLSQAPVDFRMSPQTGLPFETWLQSQTEASLERILSDFGDEPRAKKLAVALKSMNPSLFSNASQFAQAVQQALGYSSQSRNHPATRTFQALRMAINDEYHELQSLLEWAPQALKPGGRLAIISFHSIEDRLVKHSFRNLVNLGGFDILSTKPVVADEQELQSNIRARSAKLRVLARLPQRADNA